MILPFAMSDDQIAALAGRTTAIPAWPRLELSGECNVQIDARGEIVEGTNLIAGTYNGIVDNGTYKEYAKRIGFELASVKDI